MIPVRDISRSRLPHKYFFRSFEVAPSMFTLLAVNCTYTRLNISQGTKSELQGFDVSWKSWKSRWLWKMLRPGNVLEGDEVSPQFWKSRGNCNDACHLDKSIQNLRRGNDRNVFLFLGNPLPVSSWETRRLRLLGDKFESLFLLMFAILEQFWDNSLFHSTWACVASWV